MAIVVVFQFLIGTIKTLAVEIIGNFDKKFQFLIGTIKTSYRWH